MTRRLRLTLGAAVLMLGRQACVAQDLLLQPRPGELLVGPVPLSQTVLGVELPLRASAFLVATPGDERLRINTRVVADLFKLQDKIGQIVDTISLPTNNCDHQGGSNLFARVWGKRLTIDGRIATLTLNGDVEQWFCVLFPWRIQQPFDATLPFTLERVDAHAVAVKLGDPHVDLGGALGGVTSGVLRIAGVDINSVAKEALDRTIDPKLLRVAVPDYLLWLNPEITRADLVSNNGALAASVEMTTVLDPKAILELVKALLNRPHSQEEVPPS
jgi:hypothetical protein